MASHHPPLPRRPPPPTPRPSLALQGALARHGRWRFTVFHQNHSVLEDAHGPCVARGGDLSYAQQALASSSVENNIRSVLRRVHIHIFRREPTAVELCTFFASVRKGSGALVWGYGWELEFTTAERVVCKYAKN